MKTPRYKKRIHFMPHFFERVLERKLFETTKKAKDITIKAIKNKGILTQYKRDDCDCICIFEGEKGMLVVTPILETATDFICRTIFKAEDHHRKIYNERKIKRKG